MIKHLFLFCIIFLSGCDSFNNNEKTNSNKFQHSILKFGTVIDVTIIGNDQKLAQQAFAILEDDFTYWHKSWNPWLNGPLARVNKLLPTEAAFSLPLHIIPLIEQSQILYQQSEGLFNPAIGHLINLWRFHEYQEKNKQPPAAEKIKALVQQNPNMLNLALDGIQLKSNNANVQLNFGAFAKGYAIEKSINTLQKLGITSAVINAGGDLKVLGQHNNRAWRIGIRHPRNNNDIIASVEAKNNESIFTSGDYERYFIFNNKRYNHILDPRTGYPADKSQSVTVIHNDAGIADAAATALFIAGAENWHKIAQKMGIKYVMLIAADGTIHMSPAMMERTRLNNIDESSVKISSQL